MVSELRRETKTMCRENLCDNRFELRFIEGFCAAAAVGAESISSEKFKYVADRIKAHLDAPVKKRKYTRKAELPLV